MKRKSFLQIILCFLVTLAIACSPVLACSSSPKQITGVELKSATVVYTGDVYSLTVDGLPEGANVKYTYNGASVEGVTEEGEYEVIATVSKDGYKTKTLTATLTITEPEEMTGVTLVGREVFYSGQKYSLTVDGLPEGANVTYTYNGENVDGVTETGTYSVVATITKKGYKTKTLTATLFIAKLDEIIGVSLTGDKILYDGQSHSLTVDGLPEGANVAYTYNGASVEGVTEEGEYEVVAIVSKDGYNPRTLTATLIIYKPKFTFTTSAVENTNIPTVNTTYPALVNVPLEADVFSSKDLETSHTPVSPVTITLTASSAISNGGTASVSGSAVNITSSGTFYIKGNASLTSKIQIVVNDTTKADNVYIVLQNANLTVDGKAPLYVKSAKKVFLILEGENTLTSTGTFPETDVDGVDATIFTRANLTIKGSGSLTVTSVKKGIVAKDNLRVTGGTLTVNATARAIDANDCFSITNAKVTLSSVNNDGVTVENLEDATKGYFFMNSGSLKITAKKDGIQTSGAFEMLGGTLDITSGGGNTVVSDPLLTSAKGVKATGDILISGGNITIDASEDAIHGSSSIMLNGGELNLSSNKDAIDVDKAIVVDGATITSLICSDGLKGESVTVKNGTISIKALEDGLKAIEETGDTSTDSTTSTTVDNTHKCFINITGGNVSVDVEDNALDSKGNIAITGGEVSMIGSSLGSKALNYNGSASVTNGKVTAVALKEKAVNFSNATPKSLLISLDEIVSAGTKISIKKGEATVFETTITKDASSILIANVLTSGEYDFIIGENTEPLII